MAETAKALLATPKEAATVLRLGRTKVYELMASGRLPSIKIDGSRRIPITALEEYVAGLVADAA